MNYISGSDLCEEKMFRCLIACSQQGRWVYAKYKTLKMKILKLVCWLKRFKAKYRISLRVKTHQGQTSLSLPNLIVDNFARDVKNKMVEM